MININNYKFKRHTTFNVGDIVYLKENLTTHGNCRFYKHLPAIITDISFIAARIATPITLITYASIDGINLEYYYLNIGKTLLEKRPLPLGKMDLKLLNDLQQFRILQGY